MCVPRDHIVLNFEFLSFEFVSDFDIRISDLLPQDNLFTCFAFLLADPTFYHFSMLYVSGSSEPVRL
jgi:hypothetical protein